MHFFTDENYKLLKKNHLIISQTNSYRLEYVDYIIKLFNFVIIESYMYLFFYLRFFYNNYQFKKIDWVRINIDNYSQLWLMIILSIKSAWLIRYVPLLKKTFSGWIRNSLLSPHRNQTLCQQFDKLSLSTCINCIIL